MSVRAWVLVALFGLSSAPALSQVSISQLPGATTPLSGTEAVPMAQSGVTVRATPLQIGAVTVIGSPGTIQFSGGENVLFAKVFNLTAMNTTTPESALYLGMTSGVGSGNPVTANKSLLRGDVFCNSGSAWCWDQAIVMNIGSGGTQRSGIGIELDLNNNQGDFSVTPASNFAANFYATGTPNHISNAAYLAIDATGTLWHQGFALAGSSVVDTAAFEDLSIGAPTSFLGFNGVFVGSNLTESRRALVHTYGSSSGLLIEHLAENDNATTGSVAYGFSTSLRANGPVTKGGIAYQNEDTDGRGTLLFCNDSNANTTDFTLASCTMFQPNGGGWEIGAEGSPPGDNGFGTLDTSNGYAVGGTLGVTKACSVTPTGMNISGGIITAITGGTCS